MAGIQAYEIEGVGVVIIDGTTNEPLPLSVIAFDDADEAEAWLQSLGCDVRRLAPESWPSLITQWRRRRRA